MFYNRSISIKEFNLKSIYVRRAKRKSFTKIGCRFQGTACIRKYTRQKIGMLKME